MNPLMGPGTASPVLPPSESEWTATVEAVWPSLKAAHVPIMVRHWAGLYGLKAGQRHPLTGLEASYRATWSLYWTVEPPDDQTVKAVLDWASAVVRLVWDASLLSPDAAFWRTCQPLVTSVTEGTALTPMMNQICGILERQLGGRSVASYSGTRGLSD